jgi:hypothetical protein
MTRAAFDILPLTLPRQPVAIMMPCRHNLSARPQLSVKLTDDFGSHRRRG